MTVIVFGIAFLSVACAFLAWQLYTADKVIDDLEDQVEILRLREKHWRWEKADRRSF